MYNQGQKDRTHHLLLSFLFVEWNNPWYTYVEEGPFPYHLLHWYWGVITLLHVEMTPLINISAWIFFEEICRYQVLIKFPSKSWCWRPVVNALNMPWKHCVIWVTTQLNSIQILTYVGIGIVFYGHNSSILFLTSTNNFEKKAMGLHLKLQKI